MPKRRLPTWAAWTLAALMALAACSLPTWDLEDAELLETATVPPGATMTWRADVTLTAPAVRADVADDPGHGEVTAIVELRLADPGAGARPVQLTLTGVNATQSRTVTVTGEKTRHVLSGFGLTDCVPDFECLRSFELQVTTPAHAPGGVVVSGMAKVTFFRRGDQAPAGAELFVDTERLDR